MRCSHNTSCTGCCPVQGPCPHAGRPHLHKPHMHRHSGRRALHLSFSKSYSTRNSSAINSNAAHAPPAHLCTLLGPRRQHFLHFVVQNLSACCWRGGPPLPELRHQALGPVLYKSAASHALLEVAFLKTLSIHAILTRSHTWTTLTCNQNRDNGAPFSLQCLCVWLRRRHINVVHLRGITHHQLLLQQKLRTWPRSPAFEASW